MDAHRLLRLLTYIALAAELHQTLLWWHWCNVDREYRRLCEGAR